MFQLMRKLMALFVVMLLLLACQQSATSEEADAGQETSAAEAVSEDVPAGQYNEAPMLTKLVRNGELPPVDERLPENPLVIEPVEEIGQYGGTWRKVDSSDGLGYTKMTAYVEPFVKWKRDVNGSRPNLVESWEWNDDATELVAHFRRGIKWSDGAPLTVDDYLFWWNDLVLDDDVPIVEPAGTRVKGELMLVEKMDDFSLRFKFAAPHPLFLELHSRGFYHSATFLVPSHYLKQFHPKYNDAVADSNDLVDHYNNRHQYPDMPTHTPWRVIEFLSGQRAVLERNPYYWKVDTAGNQLPYIDRIEVEIAQGNPSELVVLKAIAGELDMQVRDIPLPDVPLVLENAEAGDYRVIMWNRGDYAWPWIMLFYDYPDEGIVELMYEQKFRQALSYAIDRERINEIVALGLGKPRQFALSPESPEFQTPEGKKFYEEWSTSYANHDPDLAKSLLDEIGVVDTDGDGIRERPNGEPLELIVETSINDQKSIDSMDLVKEDWEAVGLKTILNPIDGSVLSDHTRSGEIMIRAWGSAAAWGLISASPVWAPIEGVTYAGGGARIGQHYQTGGAEGIPARPGSMLARLQELYSEVITIADPVERDAKLLEAYRVHLDEGPITIGTVGEHPSPVVVKNNFHNVPDFGLVAGWDLSFPGSADPEQFFIR